MTARFQVNGSDTTITFEYTATTVVIADIARYAADELQRRGHGIQKLVNPDDPDAPPILTNKQILTILDKHIKRVLRDMAMSGKLNADTNAAKIQSQTEFNNLGF